MLSMTASDAALLVHANLEPVLWRYYCEHPQCENVHGEVLSGNTDVHFIM